MPEVIKHCEAVSNYAVSLARKIRDRGHKVDVEFIEVAALLHDVGRSKTHGIDHGLAGAKILSDHPGFARVCERHIGAGLTKEEAEELGLPKKDFLPETIEEKIIAHADNMVRGSEAVSLKETTEFFEKRLGKNHPGVERVKKLSDEIKILISE